MNNYSDINVKCSHCTRKFQGATHLLLHFFEHIEQFPVGINPLLKTELVDSMKTKNVTSTVILEDIKSNSINVKNDVKYKNEIAEEVDISKEEHESPKIKKEKRLPEKVVENVQNNDNLNVDSTPYIETKAQNVTVVDDFSPLKFCVITMDNNDENLEFKKYTKQILPKTLDCSNREVAHLGKPQCSSKKRNYFCHLCSKTFGWMTDLKRHILTHTGERPFKCPKCDIAFTRKFLLQRHISKIHCNKLHNEDSALLDKKVEENLEELSRTTEFRRSQKAKLYSNNNK